MAVLVVRTTSSHITSTLGCRQMSVHIASVILDHTQQGAGSCNRNLLCATVPCYAPCEPLLLLTWSYGPTRLADWECDHPTWLSPCWWN
jgi:hypothetical protein